MLRARALLAQLPVAKAVWELSDHKRCDSQSLIINSALGGASAKRLKSIDHGGSERCHQGQDFQVRKSLKKKETNADTISKD